MNAARTSMLLLCAAAGGMAGTVASVGIRKGVVLASAITAIVEHALDVSILLGINLHEMCLKKMLLNDAKYPPGMCGKEVRNGQSEATGIPNEIP